MDPDRINLHEALRSIIGSGTVYYQPPGELRMSYPCIVYSRTTMKSKYANDGVYGFIPLYEVMVIYKDPDSTLPSSVAGIPGARFDRHFISENLYHDVFVIPKL